MSKGFKYAFVFVNGVTIGIGVCGIKLIGYALRGPHIRRAVGYKIVDKIDEVIYGDHIVN